MGLAFSLKIFTNESINIGIKKYTINHEIINKKTNLLIRSNPTKRINFGKYTPYIV